MRVRLVVTSDLQHIADLHTGQTTLPWSLTTQVSIARRPYRHRDVRCWLDVENSAARFANRDNGPTEDVRIVHHSAVLASSGAGFVAKVADASPGHRRESSRYPRITFRDILAIVERSIKITDEDSVELIYLTDNGVHCPIPVGDDCYIIDPETINTPKAYSVFIGATKYTQSHFVDNDVRYIRHEFVDIAGRLWIHTCVETDTVESSEIDLCPAGWGTRIIYSKQEQLNG